MALYAEDVLRFGLDLESCFDDVPLSPYGTVWEIQDLKRENELRAFIRWEMMLLKDCEVCSAQQEAWVEFARQCDAEYESRKKREEWTEVRRPKRVPRPKRGPQDIDLICRDCGRDFMFSVEEQEKFEKRDWDQPKTCVSCILLRNN